jgi:hypothetical protein
VKLDHSRVPSEPRSVAQEAMAVDATHFDSLLTKFEGLASSLLRALKMPHICRELVIGLLQCGGNKIAFECSYRDLAIRLFGAEGASGSLRHKVRYRLEKLEQWQQDNGMELLRRTKIGTRSSSVAGGLVYQESSYEWKLLRPFICAIIAENYEQAVTSVNQIAAVKSGEIASPLRVKIRNQVGRDEATIKSKMRKVLMSVFERGDDPVLKFKTLIKEMAAELRSQQSEWEEEIEIERFLSEFEVGLRVLKSGESDADLCF